MKSIPRIYHLPLSVEHRKTHASLERSKKELGYHPKTKIETGLLNQIQFQVAARNQKEVSKAA